MTSVLVYEKFENFSPKTKQKYSNPKTCMEGSQLTSFVITVEKGMEEEMEKSVVRVLVEMKLSW